VTRITSTDHFYANYHYDAGCRYAKCGNLFVIMLSIIMLSVVMLSVVMLSVVMLSVATPFLGVDLFQHVFFEPWAILLQLFLRHSDIKK
jgi:hypothetical protein